MRRLTGILNVRPWGGPAVDIAFQGDRIAAVTPHAPGSAQSGSPAAHADVLDGRGLLALPSIVNAHAHVDKSWMGLPWQSYGGESTMGYLVQMTGLTVQNFLSAATGIAVATAIDSNAIATTVVQMPMASARRETGAPVVGADDGGSGCSVDIRAIPPLSRRLVRSGGSSGDQRHRRSECLPLTARAS